MNRSSLLATSVSVFLAIPPAVWAQPTRGNYHGSHMMWDGAWMGAGPLMMFAVIAVIVGIVLLLVRSFGERKISGHVSSETSALEILQQRFARGDIDKDEYEERRRRLRD
jgi:putative membrane protein